MRHLRGVLGSAKAYVLELIAEAREAEFGADGSSTSPGIALFGLVRPVVPLEIPASYSNELICGEITGVQALAVRKTGRRAAVKSSN